MAQLLMIGCQISIILRGTYPALTSPTEDVVVKHLKLIAEGIAMSIRHQFRKFLWKTGYDLFKFDVSHPVMRRRKLLEFYNINVVLDVGANFGQFAEQLRYDVGYGGKIVSFEPLSSA